MLQAATDASKSAKKGAKNAATKQAGSSARAPGPPPEFHSHEHFAKHDKNGDGALDAKELTRALRGTPLDPRNLSGEDVQSLKDFLASSDGRIAYAQWKSLWEEEDDDDEEEQQEEAGREGGGEGGKRGGGGKQSGGGKSYEVGDLVRIVGFEMSDKRSILNGEIGTVESLQAGGY